MNKKESFDSISYQIKKMPIAEVLETIAPIPLKTEPKEHQAKSLYIGIGFPCWMFALDMGLGKTKIALDLITTEKFLNGKVKALVTCPPIVMGQWRREVKKHSELSCCIVDQPKSEDKVWNLKYSNAEVTVVSKNWITLLFAKAEKDGMYDKFLIDLSKKYNILIIDEAHTLKNRTTKGFKGFRKYFLNIPKRYLLTGTPIGNNYTEVWSQYYLIDRGQTFGRSFAKFRDKYFVVISRGGYDKFILRKNYTKEFTSLFWSRVSRYEEKECNDLPEKTYTTIPVTMTNEQNREYDDLLEKIAKDNEYDDKNRGLSSDVFKLMRITAGTAYEKSPKLDTLKEIVRQVCVDLGKQIIIWCWLRDESIMVTEALKKEFKNHKVRAVNGSVSANEKESIVKQWKSGDVRILVANQKSLGVGVDLYETNYCCYFSNNLSFIDRQQSEKRIHRTGQKNHCYYIDLVCESTIDEVILNLLLTKKTDFKQLTDDGSSSSDDRTAIDMAKKARQNTKIYSKSLR